MAGEVTGIGLKSEENFKRHLYHFSKENIASLPSSYILPKDSPLEVGAKDCFFISFPVAEKVIYMQGLQQTASQPEE